MTSKFDRSDPSDDPLTDAGRGTGKPDRKYRCTSCNRLFDLPDMTKHRNETGHDFSYHGLVIDWPSDVFAAEYGMSTK